MSPEDALRFGLRDKYVVRVRVEGDRELIFGDVVVRVNPNYRLAMHIDTDEGNAGQHPHRHDRLHRRNPEPALNRSWNTTTRHGGPRRKTCINQR